MIRSEDMIRELCKQLGLDDFDTWDVLEAMDEYGVEVARLRAQDIALAIKKAAERSKTGSS